MAETAKAITEETRTFGNILQKLAEVQKTLKAPKDRTNSFGKYNYRSCEDILEAAKPLITAAGLLLLINDEIVFVEGRFYVKATATIYDTETKESLYCSAYAREADSKSGMDAAQVTGACSSYARKYALNALLCIDDTKDADTDEHAAEAQARANKSTEKKAAPKAQAKKEEPKPAEAESKKTEKGEDFPERAELRKMIHDFGLDGHKIAVDCGLGPKSTAEEYKKAIQYAKKLREEQARAIYAQTLVKEAGDDTQVGT